MFVYCGFVYVCVCAFSVCAFSVSYLHAEVLELASSSETRSTGTDDQHLLLRHTESFKRPFTQKGFLHFTALLLLCLCVNCYDP